MKSGMRPLLVLVGVILVGGLLWAGWQWLRPIPRFNARLHRTMLLAGRANEAEALARAHLRLAPNDPQANMVLAIQVIDRADASQPDDAANRQAEEALQRLGKAAPKTAYERALVKLYEGKALYILKRWSQVEDRMKAALELFPTIPEAGWALLDLYYLQRRAKDASELALALHQVEPDPRDRVQLLLELVRQDAQPTDPASIVDLFRAALEADPEDVRAAVTLGDALIRDSRAEEGLESLRGNVDRHPESPVAWEGLLAGYDEAGRLEALAEALDRLPETLADDPRFARYRGRVAQNRGDWPAAVAAYREAFELAPHDPTLLYLLSRVLRFADEATEGEELLARHEAYKVAMQQVVPLYEEANSIAALGERPNPSLYGRLADLRERLLWPEQAAAWRRLAQPDVEPATAEADVPTEHLADAPAS